MTGGDCAHTLLLHLAPHPVRDEAPRCTRHTTETQPPHCVISAWCAAQVAWRHTPASSMPIARKIVHRPTSRCAPPMQLRQTTNAGQLLEPRGDDEGRTAELCGGKGELVFQLLEHGAQLHVVVHDRLQLMLQGRLPLQPHRRL